ncbi:hypothetical protein QJ054_33760 [Streptomyces sp. AN-3]|uniref:hypothetical protein n=1 Tax=Streptomyces sp. AN-3 TaxID=3044177 RepID=UPI00249CF22B|nr:hypothetical protein [Streptomyces sp. AN-3]MDI3102004.1 hypothetical protein [Streptomyces sp. AN-3]
MTSHASPAPARVSPAQIDAALMRLPYDQWVVMPAAAAHVRDLGLPSESLTTVIRTGRRRGVLRTKKEPDLHLCYVMRIAEEPRRRAPRPRD